MPSKMKFFKKAIETFYIQIFQLYYNGEKLMFSSFYKTSERQKHIFCWKHV